MDQKPNFGDDHFTHDASYEGGNFFKVTNCKGMNQSSNKSLPNYTVACLPMSMKELQRAVKRMVK